MTEEATAVPQISAPPTLSERVLKISETVAHARETLVPMARTDYGRTAIARAIDDLEAVTIRAVAGGFRPRGGAQ